MGKIDERYDIESLADELGVELYDTAELFYTYFEEMRSCIKDAQAYSEQEDWPMLSRVVHNIKGVSASLGVNDVYESALFLEGNLKTRQYEGALVSLINIKVLLEKAEYDIRKYFTVRGYIPGSDSERGI